MHCIIIVLIWSIIRTMPQLVEFTSDGDHNCVACDGYLFNLPTAKGNGLTTWRCASKCGLYLTTIGNDGSLQFDSFGTSRSHTTKHIYKIKNEYGPPPTPFDPAAIDLAMKEHSEYAQNWWGFELKTGANLEEKQSETYSEMAGLIYLESDDAYEVQTFCSQAHAEIIRNAPWLAFDGSFKSTPKLGCGVYYGQVFHIVAIYPAGSLNQTPMAVASACVLMRRVKPDHIAYEHALDILNQGISREYGFEIFHDKNIDIMTDMEGGMRIAIKNRWKNGKQHICFFHYCQALFVNIGKKGLFSVYRNDGQDNDFGFYKYARCYMCLALIHPAVVVRAWNLLYSMVDSETPANYIDEMWNFVEYHRGFYMKDVEFIMAWNCYRLLMRSSNSLECRNFINNRRFGTHPEWWKWIIKNMEMFANSLNDFISWKGTGVTHRRGKKEVFKNKRLIQLWTAMDEKIVSKKLDGKVTFDTSKVSDEEILYFLNESSKALKVDGDTLKQMCEAFDRNNENDTQ
eukprot:304040_1